MEPTQGRVTFDIDPAATGLVLREASRVLQGTVDWMVLQAAPRLEEIPTLDGAPSLFDLFMR